MISPLKARLSVLAVFLVGFVSGAITLQLLRLRAENRIFHSRNPMAAAIVYKLDDQLSLTPEQRREATAAIVAARDEFLKLDLAPAVRASFDTAVTRIRKTLDPAQREKFDRIVAERRLLVPGLAAPPAEPPGVKR